MYILNVFAFVFLSPAVVLAVSLLIYWGFMGVLRHGTKH